MNLKCRIRDRDAGVLLLAMGGLLEGRRAATHPSGMEFLGAASWAIR